MSTYNGEKYLQEQLNSIRNQTNMDWKLYIRDDGSTDKTTDIIRKNIKEDSRIIFFNDNTYDEFENLGVAKSFMKLLEVVDADYYMFADQDDFWLPDKVARSIEIMDKLENEDRERPNLVYVKNKIVDSNLECIEFMTEDNDMIFQDSKKNPQDLLVVTVFFNHISGCSLMFNRCLKNLACNVDLNMIDVHDYWIALVAASIGKIEYINEPLFLYRQHNNNEIGGKDFLQVIKFTMINRDISKLKMIFTKRIVAKAWPKNSRHVSQVRELKRLFYSKMSDSNKKITDEMLKAFDGKIKERMYFVRKYLPKRATFVRRIVADVVFILGGFYEN